MSGVPQHHHVQSMIPRQHQRIAVDLPCQVAVAGGVFVTHASDLSEGGMAFDASNFVAYPPRSGSLRELLPDDALVQVELPLPDGALVVAGARVRWVGHARKCGVQFEHFLGSGQEALVAYVRREIMRRASSHPGSRAT